MKKVFLGGTCNESQWRDYIMSHLKIDYFNPVVEDWTPECQDEEIRQRKDCDYCLYVITPKMTGVYAIAEIIDDSNKRPDKTLFCFLAVDEPDRFTVGQVKSLEMVSRMVRDNGGKTFQYISDVVNYLNKP